MAELNAENFAKAKKLMDNTDGLSKHWSANLHKDWIETMNRFDRYVSLRFPQVYWTQRQKVELVTYFTCDRCGRKGPGECHLIDHEEVEFVCASCFEYILHLNRWYVNLT